MMHLFVILTLLQPAPMGPPTACADSDPQPARIGQAAPCTGVVISEGDSRKIRKLAKERDTLRVKLAAESQRLDLVTLHAKRDGDRLDALIDRGLQMHAKTEAPAPATWLERPGWGTVWGIGVSTLILGAVGAWALTKDTDGRQ